MKTIKMKKNTNGTYTVNGATDRQMLELILTLKRRKEVLNQNWGLALFDVFSSEEIDNFETMTYVEIIRELNGDV